MSEFLRKAKEEYHRVDHLVYVSLKYTRTCDVIKHAVERMISTLDLLYSTLLERYEQEGKISDLPSAPLQRCKLLEDTLPPENEIRQTIDLYRKLRKIDKAEFTRSNEFRRHVTLTAKLGDEIVELHIDNITEYLKIIKVTMEQISKIIEGES
jgi:hypothetical protein